MTMSALPSKPVSAVRTLFVALALAIVLVSAAQPKDATWQEEITSWRAQHAAVRLLQFGSMLRAPGSNFVLRGGLFGRGRGDETNLPPRRPPHPRARRLGGHAPPRTP